VHLDTENKLSNMKGLMAQWLVRGVKCNDENLIPADVTFFLSA